ncbi:alternate-type signal peptide domain-containing protein [Glaciibacter psychrotolerans]|uniref:Alternate signal-mediated exported protein n=1 Tax=Glaciibacter psychrotolerans TaxID=670054 RepID=A0A7Z0J774_9MICO|nr:alternate-type signal peptide domain-containing protein [Leifsonia psychrotolerans]NYJ20648.1 alternate signal-mediated exported protein [Leifsonia psychrotolerans]
MNKLLKGSLAGAAGIALLLGGAGTFASWNDTAGVTGGTIVAGNLKLIDSTTGTWTVSHDGGAPAAIANIATFRAVPGDVLTYSSSVKVVATGDNLVATLSLSATSVTPTVTTNAADIALAAYLTKNATITATGTGITAIGSTGTYKITNGANSVAAVKVAFGFPKDAVAGAEDDTKLGSVNFSALAVTLAQN